MANEFIARKGIISLDSIQVTGSITATGGITISGSISSASFATTAATASSADNFFVRQNLTASSALFTGSITAQTLVVQTVTSSIVYSSGSNIFGNLPSNVQQFTGSLRVTGSGNHWVIGGNVGLGTSSPSYNLHIQGASPRIWMVDTTTNGSCFEVAADTTSVGIFNRSNLPLVLGTNNTTRLTIAATGGATFTCGVTAENLNINSVSTSPVGLTITSGDETFIKFMNGVTKNWGFITTNLAGSDFGIYQSNAVGGDPFTAGVPKLYFNGSGNVGIGTNSPSVPLHVSGSAGSQIRYSSPNVSNVLGVTGADVGIVGTVTGHDLALYTNATERMRITSGGNVGIGGTPSRRLDVYVCDSATYATTCAGNVLGIINTYPANNTFAGITFATEPAAGNAGLAAINSTVTSAGNADLMFSTRASSVLGERLRITSEGLVGINKTNPEVWLHIEDCNARTSVGAYTFPLHIENRCNQGAQSGYTGIRFKNIYNGIANYGYILQEAIGSSFDYAPRIYIGGYTGGAYTNRMSVDVCTGAVGIKATSISSEANLFLGAQGTVEGGQLVLQKGTSCSCATHLDNYQNIFRILSGTDTVSNAQHFMLDHTTLNACFYGCVVAPNFSFIPTTISNSTSTIFAAGNQNSIKYFCGSLNCTEKFGINGGTYNYGFYFVQVNITGTGRGFGIYAYNNTAANGGFTLVSTAGGICFSTVYNAGNAISIAFDASNRGPFISNNIANGATIYAHVLGGI